MQFDFDGEYFNAEHTLECGQIFRYEKKGDFYKVYSGDKACLVKNEGNKAIFICDDPRYFYNFFDLDRDYKEIVERAKSSAVPLLARSAEKCKGLRILNQDKEEVIYSFIISQNNNIPRIKSIIEKLCKSLGDEFEFLGEKSYAFPKTQKLAKCDPSFFKSLGCGYRDCYLAETSKKIFSQGIAHLDGLNKKNLTRELLKYKGIGEKVADCITLFAFKKTESFPVDTWIEKVYKEDLGGKLNSPKMISEYLSGLFKEYSGYFQQYLFYGKRLNL